MLMEALIVYRLLRLHLVVVELLVVDSLIAADFPIAVEEPNAVVCLEEDVDVNIGIKGEGDDVVTNDAKRGNHRILG